MSAKKPNIVVIGGGTGTYTVLTGLREYPVHLSAIVSMTDSGGSNRVLRDEFGLLPTSDLRQCIVALASRDSNGLIRELFAYRYHQGTGIDGMTFGNLFMAALTDIYGSQETAIEKTCKFLNVQGNVIPVTYDNVHLMAKYENGSQVLGEHYIDEPDQKNGKSRITELSVVPDAKVNKQAIDAILNADLIVLGPGDLFTSTICNLIIEGVREAFQKTNAKVVYVINLMTKLGQTNGYTASDHLKEIQKYLGEASVDVVFVNKKIALSSLVKKRYAQEHAELVLDDIRPRENLKIVRKEFRADGIIEKAKGDRLVRSLIRHDSHKLAEAIMREL